MPRILPLFAALIIVCLCAGLSVAQEPAAQPEQAQEDATEEPPIVRELEFKLKTNQMFLKAAAQIASAAEGKEVKTYLRMAEEAAQEAFKHYAAGEYEFAIEDVSESTRMATYAIIMAHSGDASLKEAAIQEELILSDEREHARKEKMIKKGVVEVETFIMTAERLLAEGENALAREKLEEAIGLLASSKKFVAAGKYDNALADINRGYTLATQSVKAIKGSQGDIITFPKTSFASAKEELSYELKKNETYMFFAGQVVKNDDRELMGQINDAKGVRDGALKAMEVGDDRQAIDGLRTSTKLLIKIIRSAVNN